MSKEIDWHDYWWHTPCYLCKQYCFHYLSICWCTNEKCENYNQTDSDLPHHIVTFADMVDKE